MALRAGFGPRAIVWGPLVYSDKCSPIGVKLY